MPTLPIQKSFSYNFRIYYNINNEIYLAEMYPQKKLDIYEKRQTRLFQYVFCNTSKIKNFDTCEF